MAALKKIVHSFLLYFLLFTSLYYVASGKKKPNGNENDADKWKKKDIRDYTDADLERLYEQWEVRLDDLIRSRFYWVTPYFFNRRGRLRVLLP